MGKVNNIAFDILLILCIAFDRQTGYNKAILGEGVSNARAPPERRKDHASIKGTAKSG